MAAAELVTPGLRSSAHSTAGIALSDVVAATWCQLGHANIEALVDAPQLVLVYPGGIVATAGGRRVPRSKRPAARRLLPVDQQRADRFEHSPACPSRAVPVESRDRGGQGSTTDHLREGRGVRATRHAWHGRLPAAPPARPRHAGLPDLGGGPQAVTPEARLGEQRVAVGQHELLERRRLEVDRVERVVAQRHVV